MPIQLTTPEIATKAKNDIFGRLLEQVEKAIQSNLHTFDGSSLNVLVDDVEDKAFCSETEKKLQELYVQAGWDTVEITTAQDNNRLRIKLYKW